MVSAVRTAGVALVASLMVATAGCTSSPSPSVSSAGTPQTTNAAVGLPSAGASPSISAGGLPAVPEIVKEVEPAVVTIRTEIGLGSGVVYHSDGTIVTDAHVVENQQHQPYKTVKVQFADGKQVSAKVIGVDDITDVAVIKADRSGLTAPKFATSEPTVGQMTVVIGSPLGLVETVTAGIVSGLHRDIPPSSESPQGIFNLIQTDAPISPGNSGGAVANGDSEIIGLAEAYLPPSTGAVAIGFLTPASTVTDVADQLLKNGTVKHAFLGVRLSDISPQMGQRFNLGTTSGALVIDVVKDGPADTAGIESGDIITKFGGAQISKSEDLLLALRGYNPGQKVQISILRGKNQKTLTLILANQPGS